jgi:fluoride ion exporter CrcB/FEX
MGGFHKEIGAGGRRKSGGTSPKATWIDRYVGNSVSRDSDDEGTLAVIYILVFAAFIFIIIFLFRTLPHLFSILDKNIQEKWVLGFIGAISTTTVGVSLYYLRSRKRMLYALLELAFAIVTGWTAIFRLASQGDLGVWLALGAASYLIVRGLDNWHQAKEEKKKIATTDA